MTQIADLRGAFAKAGYVDISDATLTIRMDFADFDDYWRPFMTGQGTLEAYVVSLPERLRSRVLAGVRAAYLCGKPDGPRSFAGVAWAVKGVVPQG